MYETEGITVIIPTIGRETLKATLASLVFQLTSDDAVVVVSEGDNLEVKDTVYSLANCYPDTDWSYVVEYGGCWGHPNRNYVMDHHVHTSHVWTIDDDDIATPNALDILRNHLSDPWTVFRMTFGEGHFASGLTCWRSQTLSAGDIGTPMIFARHSKSRFGDGYMGDYAYALNLQTEFGEPVWSEEVVAVIRPEKVPE